MPAPRAVCSFLASLLVAVGALAAAAPPGRGGTVAWPASTGLLIAEVVTGGASASDEYVELYNASRAPADLAGHEVVYISASGATITRKATWSGSLALAPGRHLLLANAAGSFAPLADATYSGGLSADGGSLALRRVGGDVVDAIGWGTAANAFVEGAAAPAPPARSSLERRPGGPAGNGIDSNDNAADWVTQATPIPQSLASPPTPGEGPDESPTPTSPGPTASDTPTPAPTETATGDPVQPTMEPTGPIEPSPTATETAEPTPQGTATAGPSETPTASPQGDPTAEPTAEPTVGPTPEATLEPTAEPTEAPTSTPAPTVVPTPTLSPSSSPEPASSPAATPSVSPSETASAEPSPSPVLSIAEARALTNGATVVVEGVLTARLGLLEGGRAGFLQDATGGVGLWLAAPPMENVAAGSKVRASGTLDDRYGQRTIRVDAGGVAVLGTAEIPAASPIATGAAGEDFEGLRVAVLGTVTEPPEALADGTGLWLDDGSGAVRVIVAPGVVETIPERGMLVSASGPLGQHSSGTSPGYRLLATETGSAVVVTPPPTPEPTAPPSAGPTATPEPTLPGSSPSPTASPSSNPSQPAPSASLPPDPTTSIAAARLHAVGVRVHVAGVVTAPPGLLDDCRLFAIQDGSGGIFVRLPKPGTVLAPGVLVQVTGTLAQPYGQLEIRELSSLATGPLQAMPGAAELTPGEVGEAAEGQLVAVQGEVGTVRGDKSGSLSFTIDDGAGTLRILASASAAVPKDAVKRGQEVRLVGVAGQRSSARGKLDGYRLWLRSRGDIEVVTVPPAEGSPTPSPSAKCLRRLVDALRSPGAPVEVEAVVTAPAGLFELGGATIVVDDGTAAVAVLLPERAPKVAIGDRVRVRGAIGSYRKAPRLVASEVTLIGTTQAPAPRSVQGELGSSLEWRLVQVNGRIASVTRLGARWRAELLVGGRQLVVVGESGAGIPASAVVKGHLVAVTGIVKRASSATLRFDLLPRQADDFRLGPALAGSGASPETGVGSAAGGPARSSPGRIDAADLGAHAGQTVTVSGLVVDVDDLGLTLDDGTARARIILAGAAADRLELIEPDDALEVSGTVEAGPAGPSVRVDDPAVILQLSGLAETAAALTPSSSEPASDDPRAADGGAPGAAASDVAQAAALHPQVPRPPAGSTPGPVVWILVALLVLAGVGLALVRFADAADSPARGLARRLASVRPNGGLPRRLARLHRVAGHDGAPDRH